MVDGKTYKAHRLAWLYVHGVWPTYGINHINTIKTDNRISNLEDISHRDNCSKKRRHLEGHLVGIYFCKRLQKWIAEIRIKRKKRYLGSFPTKELAYDAYQAALKTI